MLGDGAELKVVTGLDPQNGTTGRFSHPPQGWAARRTWWRGGRRDDLQASRELQPGVHAFWVSAEGAVDNDLVQGALEEGQLLIIELGDEQLRDPAGVDGRRLTEAGDATAHARPRDKRPFRQLPKCPSWSPGALSRRHTRAACYLRPGPARPWYELDKSRLCRGPASLRL